MKKEEFTYLCLFLSIIGLAILQVSTVYLRPQITDISTLDGSDTGDTVKIRGDVSRLYSADSATFFTVSDSTGEIQATSFESPEIRNGMNVTVLGNPEMYRGDLQIVVGSLDPN